MIISPARVVVLTSYPPNQRIVREWADRNGHRVVLTVTPPGGEARYGEGKSLAAEVGSDSSLLITGKLKTVAAQVIAAMKPDLVISAAFPRLIPPEILALPAHGALNLHPSVLPTGRGPNPIRLVYEGASTFGATLHRTEAEFDTGAVLSQRERPLPRELSGPALLAGWLQLFREVIEEGLAKALAGEPGTPQDPAGASYAGSFRDEELVVDLAEPAQAVLRKVAALNVLTVQARVNVATKTVLVRHAYEVSGTSPAVAGTVLACHDDGMTVQTGTRPIRLITV